MTTRSAASACALALSLYLSSSAKAHRLDEYLQQTLITLAPDRITLSLELTPGVDVAPALLRVVDTEPDGVLSQAEQAQYASAVVRDLSLSIDGRELPLLLLDTRYPSREAMARGVGSISLVVDAPLHEELQSDVLRFVNKHRVGVSSVYLVNTFLPRDPSLHVGAQTRSADQSTYQAELSRDSSSGSSRWTLPFALALGGAGLVVLWSTSFRGRSAPPSPTRTGHVDPRGENDV